MNAIEELRSLCISRLKTLASAWGIDQKPSTLVSTSSLVSNPVPTVLGWAWNFRMRLTFDAEKLTASLMAGLLRSARP